MRRTLALSVIAALLASCVGAEHRDVVAAREAHEACVAERGAGDGECLALEERLRSAQRRYEENARRAWGCRPDDPECPHPR